VVVSLPIARRALVVALLVLGFSAAPIAQALAQVDALPSWNEGPVKTSIIDFVWRVTTQGGTDFVPAEHAFGNSDGDLQMLQWTAAGERARFAGLVHYTDAEREYTYDRESKVGKLDKALDVAAAKGWTVVDMKKDCKAVFPAEK
jgi:hypothetical protein